MIVRASLAALILALAAPAAAQAAGGLEIGIADDAQVLSQPDAARAQATVEEWRAAGIRSVRLFAEWYKIAPFASEPRVPAGFDPARPDLYDWSRLDRAVAMVRAAGLSVVLTVTGPAPVWATEEPARRNPRWRPSPAGFAGFARLVAERFGAHVDRYVIWNEPNVPLWLQPQATCARGRCTPYSPHHYRRLVRAAGPAIEAADPGAQLLVGALAPRGSALRSRNAQMRPLAFLRAMGCVTARLARDRRGRCRRFRPAVADAFAHHPHSVLKAPDEPSGKRDDANLADLPLLVRTLDVVQARGGLRRAGGGRFPIHLTEWGYQTDPPDRLLGVSPAQQARWLQHGTYLAWRTPRVRSLVHYVWVDEPVTGSGSLFSDAAGWQSGLFTERRRAKPALKGFLRPFWAEPLPGRRARFWGQVRDRSTRTARLQVRRGGRWRTFATPTADRHGFWTATRPLGPRAESFRFVAGDRASPSLLVRPLARK